MNREIMLLCAKLDSLCSEYSDTSFRLSLARAKKDSVFTSVYEDKSKLLEEMKYWEEGGNPLIITAIWEL